MLDRLKDVEARLEELNRLLMDPEVSRDRDRLRDLSKEHAHINPIVERFREMIQAESQLAEVEEMLADPEMREMASEEKSALEEKLETLREELRFLLLPKDPYEGRNILLEIRAGTGGDEAAIFAGDLFRMYARYCSLNNWKVEELSSSEISVGGGSSGYKEIICLITSKGVYSHLKYESGVHRVQRGPVTETQGRIHTSAATVAILPEPEAVEVNIRTEDVRVDVFRASGPGGQSVNTTDSAVRLTHTPTGLVVICQDEKSQHKNKAKALKVLSARLFEQQEGERLAEESEARRSQVGTGDRSERIRTYNYPQNRITDHRAGLTLYKLDQVMEGNLDPLLEPVRTYFQAEALKAQDA